MVPLDENLVIDFDFPNGKSGKSVIALTDNNPKIAIWGEGKLSLVVGNLGNGEMAIEVGDFSVGRYYLLRWCGLRFWLQELIHGQDGFESKFNVSEGWDSHGATRLHWMVDKELASPQVYELNDGMRVLQYPLNLVLCKNLNRGTKPIVIVRVSDGLNDWTVDLDYVVSANLSARISLSYLPW